MIVVFADITEVDGVSEEVVAVAVEVVTAEVPVTIVEAVEVVLILATTGKQKQIRDYVLCYK